MGPAPVEEGIQRKLGSTPPHDLEAEEALLGCVLLDNDALAEVVQFLRADAFYRTSHRLAFEAMLKLYEQSQPIDFVTLKAALVETQNLEKVGGMEGLVRLAETVPSASNAYQYASIIRDKALLRRLIQTANVILGDAFEGQSKAQNIIDEAERRIFEVAEIGETGASFHITQVLTSTMQSLEKLRGSGVMPGLSTGYYDLDTMTCGFQPGQLIVIAGRPSMGKTTFTLNVIRNAALHGHKGVVIFSLEMAREQIASNMLCAHARVDAQKLRTADLSPEEWKTIPIGVGELAEAKIYIDDTPILNGMSLKAKARRLRAKGEIDMVVVDYLQLMESPGAESRQQEIATISRSMKALARELEIPVVAISQLSRAVDTREDHRPRMSDLRESGAIEQDADVIIFLFREEYYDKTPDNEGTCEIIVAKQRNGPTGSVKLAFLSRYLRFENLAYETTV